MNNESPARYVEPLSGDRFDVEEGVRAAWLANARLERMGRFSEMEPMSDREWNEHFKRNYETWRTTSPARTSVIDECLAELASDDRYGDDAGR